MSTEQDSVQRLAEIRALRYVVSQQEVDYLLSLIDSLTAERDEAQRHNHLRDWCGRCGEGIYRSSPDEPWNHANYNADREHDIEVVEYKPKLPTIWQRESSVEWMPVLDQRDIWRARAEAAEAEVKRLREALEWVREVAADRIGQVVGADGYYAIASHIRAVLATPPSEGGQS